MNHHVHHVHDGCLLQPKHLPRAFLGFCLILLGCGADPPKDPMTQLAEGGELVVITRNAPTTYYEGRDGVWEGFEHDLAAAFARHLGLTPRFVVLESTAEILEAISDGRGHLAAAGLTRTPEREAFYMFGPDYFHVYQEVVCGNFKRRPRSTAALSTRSLTVIGDSSYSERLYRLSRVYPDLTWTAAYEEETEQIMDRVWQGEVDCTVADSNIVEINRRYYPELRVGFRLSERQPLAWIISPETAPLQQALHRWLAHRDQQWLLADLEERYFGHVQVFDYVDLKRYTRRIAERLPEIEPLFKAAAARYGVPWTLLAAQAYQESHWRSKAKSPTGVRGMMMLTLRTASQLGVIDRTDPEQSILGGALYLKQIYARLPDSVNEPDRTWFALAAYNVGYSHLMDARKLAERQQLDPDTWRDIQQVLPLLSKPKYYKTLPHGYARGREPVRYVQRIRDFKDILERHQANLKGHVPNEEPD